MAHIGLLPQRVAAQLSRHLVSLEAGLYRLEEGRGKKWVSIAAGRFALVEGLEIRAGRG